MPIGYSNVFTNGFLFIREIANISCDVTFFVEPIDFT